MHNLCKTCSVGSICLVRGGPAELPLLQCVACGSVFLAERGMDLYTLSGWRCWHRHFNIRNKKEIEIGRHYVHCPKCGDLILGVVRFI